MFVYIQSNGKMFYAGPGYTNVVGQGYSGFNQYKNKPEAQCFQDLGPIPRGEWTIGNLEPFVTMSGSTINNCMRLTPKPGTDVCGREHFWIHGGNAAGTSSQGCIVLLESERVAIGAKPDKQLKVIENES